VRNLSTARLALEQVGEHNAATLWRVMQSAHLREFQDVPRVAREEFVRRVAARPRSFDGRAVGRFEWLVLVRGRQQPVGWVSLRIGEHANGSAEIGYSLVMNARGNGYATEAALAVIEAAFATDLSQVEACCVPANAPSRRLLEAIGFTQMRVQSNGAVVRGKAVDICVYRMTREEWDAGRGRLESRSTARRQSGS